MWQEQCHILLTRLCSTPRRTDDPLADDPVPDGSRVTLGRQLVTRELMALDWKLVN